MSNATAGESRPPRQKAIFSLMGGEPFKLWLESLSRHCRLSKSVVVEHALVAYARQQGFLEEPPER